MRRDRRRWLAASAALVAVATVAVAVIGGHPWQPAAAGGAPAPEGSLTATVGVPGSGPSGTGQPPPSRFVGTDADRGSWPPPPADPTAAVSAAVAAAADTGVQQAVVVIDRTTGAVLTQQNADQPYPALSLVKLMIAADVLDRTEETTGSDPTVGTDSATPGAAGTDGTADTVGTQPPDRAGLTEMISSSDDITASDFYEQAGGDAMVQRTAERYQLTGSTPAPDGEYWGNVQTTAADMASLLSQLLADPGTEPLIGSAMLATTATAQDGVDQRFGMRAVPGAGSKQGWGCCLSGVVGIHSVGFTPERIVVVLSAAAPDDDQLGFQDGLALQQDPGAQMSIDTVTATVRAALGGPAA